METRWFHKWKYLSNLNDVFARIHLQEYSLKRLKLSCENSKNYKITNTHIHIYIYICVCVCKWSHPLWPQNKRLQTPRTTDYRHARQDRWIQTELDFTLAKNTTKPNPFEIIPLQTTSKENNWKTEKALARAAVTLDTERIKGPKPWCLWWWWWWCKYICTLI